ncbi:hypothetical protein TrRE_jg2445, partial [Triparma retinervis]
MSGNSFIPAFLGAALGVCAVLLMYGTPFKKDGHSSSISNSGSYKGVGRQADEAGLAPGSPRHSAELSRRASGRIDDSEDNEKTPDKFKGLTSSTFDTGGFTPLISTIAEISSRPSGSPILVVGIAGGSGSGKTTLAQAIYTALGKEDNVTFISHDSYYKDLSSWTMSERENQNFDHPNSLDTNLLVEHVRQLRAGQTASIPNYDFSTHSRTGEVTKASPKQVILVEGILIFAEPELTELLDVKIFVDTESDVRLIRRITRDCQERGRSLSQVLRQYTKTVRPMHIEFVEPSKRQADIIVPVGINSVALSLITDHLKTKLLGGGGGG